MIDFGLVVRNWTRLSDGCSSQYKSKYSILKLGESLEMMKEITGEAGTVRFETFGSYEGKNESDAFGSLVKNILNNAINKDRDGAIAINNAEEVVKVINTEKPESSTSKYSLWRVEAVPPTDRKPKPNGIPIKGIRKMHSFSYSGKGIRASRLSCNICTVSMDCVNCKISPDTVNQAKVEALKVSLPQKETDAEDDEDLEMEDISADEDDEDSEEEEEEEKDDDSDEELFHPGDIVWALFSRQWYSAKIVSLDEVPKELQRQLQNAKEDSVIVKFYVCKSYCRVLSSKVEELGETLIDKKRMIRHPEAYIEALSEKSYDY